MGWWNQDNNGNSFCGNMTWGDGPADSIAIMMDEVEQTNEPLTREKIIRYWEQHITPGTPEHTTNVTIKRAMQEAVHEICHDFQRTWQRNPTQNELRAGLLFHINYDYPPQPGA